MDIVLLVGRILFALIFINSGIAHFTKNAAMTGYAQYKKVPLAKLSVYVSGLMILLGGVYIVCKLPSLIRFHQPPDSLHLDVMAWI